MTTFIILSYYNIKSHIFSAFNRREFQVGVLHQLYFVPRCCPKRVPGLKSPFWRGNTPLVSCSAASPSNSHWESITSPGHKRQQKNPWWDKNQTRMTRWYLSFLPQITILCLTFLFLSEPYWEQPCCWCLWLFAACTWGDVGVKKILLAPMCTAQMKETAVPFHHDNSLEEKDFKLTYLGK